MASISTLVDSFNDNSTGAVWSSFHTGTSTIAETGGVVIATPPDATIGSNYAGYDSATTYDLTGAACLLQVPKVGSTSTNAQTYLKLTADASNNIQIVQQNGTIKAQKTVAASTTDVAAGISYSASSHLWWRIRESSGTTYFGFSSDGVTWNDLWSLANPITLTALTVEFACGTFQSETSPNFAIFDNFNIYPSGARYPHLVTSGLSTAEVMN